MALNWLNNLFGNNPFENSNIINDANAAKWGQKYGRNFANINGQLVDLDTDEIWDQNQINQMFNNGLGLKDLFSLGGQALSGLTGLANYFNNRKAMKLAQDQLNFNKAATIADYANQSNLANAQNYGKLTAQHMQNYSNTSGVDKEFNENWKLSNLNHLA